MDNLDNNQKEIEEKIKKIEGIYVSAIAKVKEFEKQQKQVLSDFIKNLEQKKIEEIRKEILNKNN